MCLRFGEQRRSTYYIIESATASNQEMVGGGGHSGYGPLVLLRHCEILLRKTYRRLFYLPWSVERVVYVLRKW